MKRLRIGITIGLRDVAETLWNNGIKQNAIFLCDALRRCPNVAHAMLVNTTPVPVTNALQWDLRRWPVAAFDDVRDDLDVLIELGGQINLPCTDYLKRRGVRLVSYCCGSEYVATMQAILFGRALVGEHLFVNQRYDGIWIIPQIAHMNAGFFEVLRRLPTRIVPFVWSPAAVEARVAPLGHGGQYRPTGRPKRLSVMEPNVDVVKFCLYPVLIAELVYRQRPQDIELLQVTNAEPIARHNFDFIALMNQLDIVRQHKAVFLGRYDTPVFLSECTDIVISHQWENPLNYAYLETCWQGYPLVHNAALCSDLGYVYRGNDLHDAARCVSDIMDHHDASHTQYRDRQRELIRRYLPDSPELIAAYTRLLDDLMQMAPR